MIEKNNWKDIRKWRRLRLKIEELYKSIYVVKLKKKEMWILYFSIL